MRKTIELKSVKDKINHFLRNVPGSISERQVLCTLLESLLFEAKAYKGYTHLNIQQVPPGCEPGIIWDDEANRAISFPDDTRRYYY